MLVILDDGADDPLVREQRGRLDGGRRSARRPRRVRGRRRQRSEVARYASLLLSGTYAAAYLRLGLVDD